MDEIFVERLKELIKGSELTYDKIAEQLGIKSKGTISKYANGKIINISPTRIHKLATFFHVSPSWLAGFTDDKYYNIKN